MLVDTVNRMTERNKPGNGCHDGKIIVVGSLTKLLPMTMDKSLQGAKYFDEIQEC